MAKLHDLFSQARRAQVGGGIGFLGKSKPESRPRAAALVVELARVTPGSAEAALKAGADGLLFTWDGEDAAVLERLKKEIASTKANNEQVTYGLRITGGWHKLNRNSLLQIKEQGIQYILLPLTAPARLLVLENRELEKVISVPMRSGDLYPLFMRNLSTLEGIAAVHLDFGLSGDIGALSIEQILQYQAVREAVRSPAFISIEGELSEYDAYALQTLNVQAIILTASNIEETTHQQLKSLREMLEKTFREEKVLPPPSIRK
jgi:hypothetical protein